MSSEMEKGIAIGLLISFFIISNIFNVLGLGWLAIYATIALAAYLFIKK